MLPRTLVAATLLVAAAAAHAQAPPPTAAPVPRTAAISVQPLSAIATVVAAEYEHAVSPTISVGIGGTGWFPGALSYRSADFKARYYVNATPLEGLSVGGSVGYSRITEKLGGTSTGVSGPTAGAMLDYGWLLGKGRALYAALGAGGKVIFVDVGDFVKNVALRYPTFRISIGRAF